jgi:acyl-CoA reductase-like NAD-dependent aldehyde dehydrogenase
MQPHRVIRFSGNADWSAIMAGNGIEQFRSDFHAIIQSQRAAHEAQGFPSVADRIDRLMRATALVLRNKEEIIGAISHDFGRRSRGDTRNAVSGMVKRIVASQIQPLHQQQQIDSREHSRVEPRDRRYQSHSTECRSVGARRVLAHA